MWTFPAAPDAGVQGRVARADIGLPAGIEDPHDARSLNAQRDGVRHPAPHTQDYFMRDSLVRVAFVLGLLAAVGPFAIDMYLPALPQVAADLGTAESAVGLTLAAYLLTFGLAQMIYGPMSDAMGRKRPMLVGVGIFAAASIGAAWAPSIGWLVASRAIQGLGDAALMVVPRAVVRDVASGPEGTRVMAVIMIVLSISPMLAPLAGSVVLAWGSWRGIFWLLAVAAFLDLALIGFALPETLPSVRQRPVRLAPIWAGTKHL